MAPPTPWPVFENWTPGLPVWFVVEGLYISIPTSPRMAPSRLLVLGSSFFSKIRPPHIKKRAKERKEKASHSMREKQRKRAAAQRITHTKGAASFPAHTRSQEGKQLLHPTRERIASYASTYSIISAGWHPSAAHRREIISVVTVSPFDSFARVGADMPASSIRSVFFSPRRLSRSNSL